MIDSITSMTSAGLDPYGTLLSGVQAATATEDTTTDTTSLGVDYLLSIYSSSTTSTDSSYADIVTARLPVANTPEADERDAILTAAIKQMQAGDFSGARDAVAPLLKDNATDPTANYITGRAYLKDGDYRKAEPYFVQVASSSPDNEQAQTDLEAVRTLQRGEAYAVNQIKRQLSHSSTSSAGLTLATYLLESKPDNLDARLTLADFYESQGRVDSAGAMYVQALEHVPENRTGELVSRLETFANAHVDDPSAHDLLARAYAAAGQLANAEDEFSKALSLSGGDMVFENGVKQDFADVYTKMGHEALNQGNEFEARRYFDQALDLSRDDTRKTDVYDLEIKSGEQAMRRGLTTTALAAFSKAALNIPTADEDHTRRDQLVTDYGILASKLTASGDLKHVVSARLGAYLLDSGEDELKRKLADAYDTYGLKLMDDGKYREALKQFKSATKLYKDDLTYAHHVGEAQKKL